MNNGALIPRNATFICEKFKTSRQMEKHLTNGDLEEPFKGPVIPFGAMVEYQAISAKDQSRLHQFGKTVLPEIFLGYALFCVEYLERRYFGCGHQGAGNFGRVSSGMSLWRKRRIVEGFGKMMGKEQDVREMWEYFCQDRARLKRFREEAEEERQARIQGQWQLESPAREYLEQVKCCNDTDCTHRMMKQGFLALKKWRVGRT